MDVGLELVVGERRIPVFALGAIEAPRSLSDFALPLADAHAMIAAVQCAFAGLREEALRLKALAICRGDRQVRLKDYRERQIRTLFGSLAVRVPRLLGRAGGSRLDLLDARESKTGQDLPGLLARLGAWMSYRYAARSLAELFPLAAGRNPERIRRATLAIGGDGTLPEAEGNVNAGGSERIDLSLDTTFLRSHDRSRGRHHEVLIGTGRSDAGARQILGTMLYGRGPPEEQVTACLTSLGRTAPTKVTAYTDGDKVLRGLLKTCGITERPILDWEHIARKLQGLKIIAGGIRPHCRRERGVKDKILSALERLNWRLWHGRLEPSIQMISMARRLVERLTSANSRARPSPKAASLRNGIDRLCDYINGQSAHLVDYAARHGAGLPIGTAPTESLANSLVNKRMNKSQQMRWSKAGAQAVINLRVAHINRILRSTSHQPSSANQPPAL